MRGITPFLWFENQAEEAAKFYVSVFPNSRITQTTRYGDEGPEYLSGMGMKVDDSHPLSEAESRARMLGLK